MIFHWSLKVCCCVFYIRRLKLENKLLCWKSEVFGRWNAESRCSCRCIMTFVLTNTNTTLRSADSDNENFCCRFTTGGRQIKSNIKICDNLSLTCCLSSLTLRIYEYDIKGSHQKMTLYFGFGQRHHHWVIGQSVSFLNIRFFPLAWNFVVSPRSSSAETIEVNFSFRSTISISRLIIN